MNARFFNRLEDVVFTTDQTFDDNIINSRPKEVHVYPHSLKMLAKCAETPLEPLIISF
jgi:hypothetical protein